ncbi:hypothetical protein PGT21_008819 [Puccinia graminis f. sp. tritici]|uniref:Uncharacterized protein n=1 Tax=Puccinia graminis f. sp. tritici TaxID=56615 RepID=A0A5B0S8J7_PUCGR|nr:hypothetical protein PGT21_008819 [Puccinia graminis f. sp. tritici]KAA1134137.1 hypothetical protein PGTUg99_029535 [Puccinia graminis f. sp. tritici]
MIPLKAVIWRANISSPARDEEANPAAVWIGPGQASPRRDSRRQTSLSFGVRSSGRCILRPASKSRRGMMTLHWARAKQTSTRGFCPSS